MGTETGRSNRARKNRHENVKRMMGIKRIEKIGTH